MKHYCMYQLCGELLWLLPEKAIYWPAEKTLLLSDLHLGKAGHFRKSGLYVPGAIMDRDLQKLETILKEYEIERIVVLGDLFHSRHNHEWEIFGEWLADKPLVKVDLVIGNHDILGIEKYTLYTIRVHQQTLHLGPFTLRHHPLSGGESEVGYVLCGHIHPSFLIQGKGRQNLKFPCFIFGDRQGILPAFGHFTGAALVKPEKEDVVFVVVDSIVLKI